MINFKAVSLRHEIFHSLCFPTCPNSFSGRFACMYPAFQPVQTTGSSLDRLGHFVLPSLLHSSACHVFSCLCLGDSASCFRTASLPRTVTQHPLPERSFIYAAWHLCSRLSQQMPQCHTALRACLFHSRCPPYHFSFYFIFFSFGLQTCWRQHHLFLVWPVLSLESDTDKVHRKGVLNRWKIR